MEKPARAGKKFPGVSCRDEEWKGESDRAGDAESEVFDRFRVGVVKDDYRGGAEKACEDHEWKSAEPVG